MASHFDELLKELARHEAALSRHDEDGFVKSLTTPVLRGFNAVDRATRAVNALGKSLGNPFNAAKPRKLAVPSKPTAAEQRVSALQKLTDLHGKIGEAAMSGKLSAVEVAQLEARHHALVQRAAEKGV